MTAAPMFYEQAAQLQALQIGLNLPAEMTAHEQNLNQLFTTAPQTNENQQQTLNQIASQQQEMLARMTAGQTQFNNILAQGMEGYERINIVNKRIGKNVLKKNPVDLQCQFCKQQVTTNVDKRKWKDDMTEDELDELKKSKCIFMIIPCFWPFLPLQLFSIHNRKSTPVIYHQCPNCNNLIGALCHGRCFYCRTAGTKEEQLEEVRPQINTVFVTTHSNQRRR